MFYIRLSELCELNNVKLSNVLSEVGLSTGNLAKWKAGASVNSDTLSSLADYFDVSIEYLLGRTDNPKPNNQPPRRKIPIIGRIKAGIPLYAEESFEGEIELNDSNADFALEVKGDSMIYAGIFEGDYVLLKSTSSARTNQIVAATYTDDYNAKHATLKYYVSDKNRGYVLRSANPVYEDIPFTRRHAIEGVFVGLIRYDEPSIHDVESLELDINQRNSQWNEAVANAINSGLSVEDFTAVLLAMKRVKG